MLYESHDDLVNKCNYYLTHDSERRQIAANGYGKVKSFIILKCGLMKFLTLYLIRKMMFKDFLKKFQSTPF